MAAAHFFFVEFSESLKLVLVQLGVYPVFVVDGVPSPLKGPAMAGRFLRGSGLDLPVVGEGAPVRRNRVFTSNVEDCVVGFFESSFLFLSHCWVVNGDECVVGFLRKFVSLIHLLV